MSALERFLSYITVDTNSNEDCEACPSSPNQLVLGQRLRDEMDEIGISDARQDENGYVYGFIPASEGCEDWPAIGFIADDLRYALPILGRQLKGFDHPDALLTGIESRTSSPVRILRNENGESSLSGLYPVGEGAGYAGGIMSAACDGLAMAEKAMNKTVK